jgi:hypothetical protein
MTVAIVLHQGGIAHLLQTDGDKTVVQSPLASPPGSTLAGRVEGQAAEFQLKVKNCRREGDGFRIEGRLRNATKDLKERLLQG